MQLLGTLACPFNGESFSICVKCKLYMVAAGKGKQTELAKLPAQAAVISTP